MQSSSLGLGISLESTGEPGQDVLSPALTAEWYQTPLQGKAGSGSSCLSHVWSWQCFWTSSQESKGQSCFVPHLKLLFFQFWGYKLSSYWWPTFPQQNHFNYKHLCESHFSCNLTLCWVSLCLHYGKSETLPWSFFYISERKEQKILQEFSDKTTCSQQCYSISRVFPGKSSTAKFTYSLFQQWSASPQLSLTTFNSWKKPPRLVWEVSLPKPMNWEGDNLLFFWSFG